MHQMGKLEDYLQDKERLVNESLSRRKRLRALEAMPEIN
jgi:hypothetical protein